MACAISPVEPYAGSASECRLLGKPQSARVAARGPDFTMDTVVEQRIRHDGRGVVCASERNASGRHGNRDTAGEGVADDLEWLVGLRTESLLPSPYLSAVDSDIASNSAMP